VISQLRGKVSYIHLEDSQIVLDVNGVGYDIELSQNALLDCPQVGADYIVATYLAVREDAMKLFGFASLVEKDTFLMLLKVSGIGAKNALSIISNVACDQLMLAIQSADVTALCKLPGIGKKTAERIIVELQDKLPKNIALTTQSHSVANSTATNQLHLQIITALKGLGYNTKNAEQMSQAALAKLGDDADVETAIKIALQQV